MIAKNFKKFMRFRRNGGRRQQNASNEEKLCYKCHKPGHMKMDCPIYKREKKERRDVWERVKRRQLSKKENKEKEKAMNAEHTPTWSDFDSRLNSPPFGLKLTISSMAREKCARASSSRSRAAPEPEPIAVEFDQNRYRNCEAADRFSAQLSSPLTPGLRLDTPFLFNIGVLKCLQDCHLDRLTDRNTILYYPDEIRLFYANLTWNISSESCTLSSYVFGRRISFSQSRLATLLDLPDSGFSFSLEMIPVAGQSYWFDRPFTIEEQLRHTLHCRQVRVASKPSLRDLPPLSRLFHHIIAHNVIPRTDGLSLVSYLDVQLLTFFRSGTPLNLPRLITLNMIRSASHPALAIPYGLLLTRILAAFDIPLLGEYIEVTRHIVLDCSTLRRKGLLDDRDRFLLEPDLENVIVNDDDEDDGDDDGDDDDGDDDVAVADADDDAGGDAGDGFDRDPPPLIIPSTHKAGTSSGPSTSGYEAILARLDMMQ
ncbi:hypothetical protein RJ639_023109 [Escallonia herrerae]|uniref:CCHC-type domain-containing protein n=1 Tax=Escallonia herrerae TaxID=1293975 RepID=A0AA88UZL0_9ASTE|nr:hypothetical protein RJ639_023109 [Escallonia herrerae]